MPLTRPSWSVMPWRRALLVVVLVMLALAFVGCDEPRGSNRPGGQAGVGQTLVSIGLWFAWAGSFAVGVGSLGFVACFVFPTIALALPWLREFLGDIAVVGLAAVLLGSSFIWLGNNPWVLAVAVVLLGAFLLYRYWPRVVRLVRRRKAQALK